MPCGDMYNVLHPCAYHRCTCTRDYFPCGDVFKGLNPSIYHHTTYTMEYSPSVKVQGSTPVCI